MPNRRKKNCPLCGEKRILLSINEAADFVHVSRKTIYRWLKAGMAECCVLPSGVTRIYQDSLIRLPQVRTRLKLDEAGGLVSGGETEPSRAASPPARREPRRRRASSRRRVARAALAR